MVSLLFAVSMPPLLVPMLLVPLVSVAAARADCTLIKLLLIVQGLMCGERQGPRCFVTAPRWAPSLGFFVAACGRGVLEDSRFRFPVCTSFLRLPGVAEVMSSRGLFFPVGAAAAPSSLVSCGCCVVGLEIVGKLCLVLDVRWCEGRNLRLVFGCSLVGGVLPVRAAASTSSSQHSSPQTMASCGRRGKGSTGCKQLACHTILHLVHSVSVPPRSHTSH